MRFFLGSSWLFITAIAAMSPGCAPPASSAATSAAPAPAPCPAVGEHAEDCPWAAMGRALASTPPKDVAERLPQIAPALEASLAADASRADLLALWGTSQNFDELANAEIVPPAVLDALNLRVHVAAREGIHTHAGVEHTYGYLLSTVRTPFGWKRARWVKPEIELGFGLSRGALGPAPSAGTLLTNVTFFAGRIAFRADRDGRGARAHATLDRYAAIVEPSIARVAYEELPVTRLTESLSRPGRTVVLRTDFVPFPRALHDSASTHLLVYSIADSSAEGPRLVTAFPVTTAFVQKALEPADLGEALPIVTRYNAFVDGVTGQAPPLRGRRGADGPSPP